MKYQVLKDVIIDGKNHKAGEEVDREPGMVARLVMLGYLGEPSSASNRAVALDSESKPRTRKAPAKKKKAD